jgi:hypothetical protein
MEKQAFTKILIFLALLSLVGCADNNKQPIVVNDKPVSVVKTDEPETSPKEDVVMVKEPVPVVVKKAEPVEVKKDVEGFEFNILRGAKKLIADNPNIAIFFEFLLYGQIQRGLKPYCKTVSCLRNQRYR